MSVDNGSDVHHTVKLMVKKQCRFNLVKSDGRGPAHDGMGRLKGRGYVRLLCMRSISSCAPTVQPSNFFRALSAAAVLSQPDEEYRQTRRN